MAFSSTIEEIQGYKNQLNELLGKKFIDQSLLLGFNNVLQSKFQTLILSDCNDYYDRLKEYEGNDNDFPNNQLDLEFKTIKIFEILWKEFHYPMIKFFQFHHANYYNDFSKKVLSSNGKDKSLKAVEIRKANDNFNKFIKQAYQFYFTLLKYFSTHFQNPLIPDKILRYFKFVVPNNAIKTFSPNLQANLIFLIHRCLLSLGDISRQRSFIELSYVNPCLSIKNFWNYYHLSNQSNKEKISLMMPAYEKALIFYNFCILLLPALNEPYNHIGMIHNLMDNKYEACYWFLRSQFTRLPNYRLGLTNMTTILKKDWFIQQLIDVTNDNKKTKIGISRQDELNVSLICLVCYYYLPENYRQSRDTIVRNLKYSKIEYDFLNKSFDSFSTLIQNSEEENLNFYIKQLVIIISFNKLIENGKNKLCLDQYNNFLFKYINKILDACRAIKFDDANKSNVLIILRLLLNWFKENKIILRNFHARKNVVISFVELLNALVSDIYEKGSASQDTNQEKIIELLTINSRPVRDYYFKEDVFFKDFSLIKFQLKDFKDDHLFTANNINLLNGDYSSLIDKSSKVPSFLDNDLFRQTANKSVGDTMPNTLFYNEIIRYENDLRLQSVMLLGKKLLEHNSFAIAFNFDSGIFDIEQTVESIEDKIEIKDSQSNGKNKKSAKSEVKGAKSTNKQKQSASNESGVSHNEMKQNIESDKSSEEQLSMKISNNLEEINSFILSHSTQLQDKLLESPHIQSTISKPVGADTLTQDPQTESGLQNMVDSLVLESSNSVPRGTGNSAPNIWHNGSSNEINSSSTQSQPVSMQPSSYPHTTLSSDYSMIYGNFPPLAPQVPQMSHIPPNYSQYFQQQQAPYFNPFSNNGQAGGPPSFPGFNEPMLATSSQSSINSTFQKPASTSPHPMQPGSNSATPLNSYQQYPQYFNQYNESTQHTKPPSR